MEAFDLANYGTKKTSTSAKGGTGKRGKQVEEDTSFLQSEIAILGTFAVCLFLFLSLLQYRKGNEPGKCVQSSCEHFQVQSLLPYSLLHDRIRFQDILLLLNAYNLHDQSLCRK